MFALMLYAIGVLAALVVMAYHVRKVYFTQKHNLSLINQRAAVIKQLFTATVDDVTLKEDEIRRIFSVYEVNRRLAAEIDEDRLFKDIVKELASLPGVTDVFTSGEEKQHIGYFSFVFGAGADKQYVYVAAPDACVYSQLPHIMSQFSVFLDRAHMYKRLQRMSITDALTGVANRRHFTERYRLEFNRSQKSAYPLSVLMIDIDHFKNVNDTYGHLVGDEILVSVAHTITEQLREIDFVARFGGEEFVVFLPETGKEAAMKAAQRVCATVASSEYRAYDEKMHISVSIGAATFPDDSDDKDALIERADAALYAAKEQGRNRVIAAVKAG